ncbi:MAG: TonB-dependent receptor, partial [Planctomycetes bacterium]|nr:TonB-dependent receptor [Planctomycetota bacterium]
PGFDTVNEGKTARLDVETALPWLRWRLGGTWRDLADGEGGDGVGRLRPSGGEDVNFDLNAEARDGSEGTWFLNAQRVRRDDLARYYKPTERNENDRDAVSFGWRSAPAGSGEGLEARVYWQEKEDRRYYLATGNVGRAEWQSLSTDWTWRSDQVLQGHRLLAGLTLRRDLGESPDDEQFTITRPNGVVTKAAPDQTWYDAGLFLRDDWRFAPQWTLSGGLRFDHFWYDADPDALYQPAVGSASLDDVDVEESSWTGGLGLVFEPAESWRTYASWSRGFRMFAPRFGISKTGYGVLVPSGVLEPVVGDSFELGVRHRRAMVETNLAGYYTRFDGFQNPVASTFEGQQFYDYNRNGTFEPDERVYVTAGNGEAWVGGIEWDARFDLHEAWSVLPNGCFATAGFMWNHGEDQTNDVPLRHTHPARGLLSVGYEEPEGLWYVELTADFVDAFTDIDPARLRSDVGYRRNPQDPSSPLVREDGLPGYTLVHLEAGARLGERARCGFEIDNLTDVNYRAAHSRMDGFGINLGLWFEVTF